MSDDNKETKDDTQQVPATSYVPSCQYQHWKDEAAKRDQSVSTFITMMVEKGLNEVQLEPESPSEIEDLRRTLKETKAERDSLRERLEQEEQQRYQVGLGRIKSLIINNPGIDRQEIINHIAENPVKFADNYIENLEESKFVKRGRNWHPPSELEEKE